MKPATEMELLSEQEVRQLESIGAAPKVDSFSGELTLHAETVRRNAEKVRLAQLSLLAQLQLTLVDK